MSIYDSNDYVLANSSLYLQIRSFELPFLLVFFAFTAIRQSSGDTVTPVILGILAIILNIVLTPILVINMNLGVSGAAYATLIGNLAFAPFVIYYLFRSKTGITISIKKNDT
jgi:Na+-driven multidrug efflux pump